MDNAINELLVDLGCFERGCVCYDHQDQVPPVEMVRKKEWVGLTDDEIDKAWRSVDYTVPWEQHRIDIARAIEAKLKEKNNG